MYAMHHVYRGVVVRGYREAHAEALWGSDLMGGLTGSVSRFISASERMRAHSSRNAGRAAQKIHHTATRTQHRQWPQYTSQYDVSW